VKVGVVPPLKTSASFPILKTMPGGTSAGLAEAGVSSKKISQPSALSRFIASRGPNCLITCFTCSRCEQAVSKSRLMIMHRIDKHFLMVWFRFHRMVLPSSFIRPPQIPAPLSQRTEYVSPSRYVPFYHTTQTYLKIFK